MDVQSLSSTITPEDAVIALGEYTAHRDILDRRDLEIARIYRAISKGQTVISVNDAIVGGGVDELGRPRLAIMRADQKQVQCNAGYADTVTFTNEFRSLAQDWHFEIPWPNRTVTCKSWRLAAQLPRIPPQHRPTKPLGDYHILWEADWTAIPRDPYLLKRIGKDAWVVLAAWDLTDVEMSVLRAHA